jgi:hypothetical protein
MTDRIFIQDDSYVRVKYWTPSEYLQKYPYLDKLKANEEIDVLNAAIYAEAIKYCLDVRAPHTYGVFQS